jgi:hypothetical protein
MVSRSAVAFQCSLPAAASVDRKALAHACTSFSFLSLTEPAGAAAEYAFLRTSSDEEEADLEAGKPGRWLLILPSIFPFALLAGCMHVAAGQHGLSFVSRKTAAPSSQRLAHSLSLSGCLHTSTPSQLHEAACARASRCPAEIHRIYKSMPS